MKQISLVLGMVLLAFTTVLAQKTVTGTVTDATGEAFIGANIVIEGGDGLGTVTEYDGTYSLQANEGDVLLFTYTGYSDERRTVGSSNVYDVQMAEGVILDDIIITGVAQGISKKKIGFSITTVDEKLLEKVPATDAANALRSKSPGVRIVQASGNPSQSAAIRLRGSTNISGSQSPLIIVDGVITDGELSDINMEDVASMEVLKGAAASALYGSLAGNGVIQIITKRGSGEEGKTTYKLRTEFGFSQLAKKYPVAKKHNFLLDSNGEFALGANGQVQQDTINKMDNDYPRYYDNEDALIKSGPWRTLSAQMASTGKNFNYFVGVQNLRQEGIVQGMLPFNRNSVRANVDFFPAENLTIKTSASYVVSKGADEAEQGQGGNVFYNVLTSSPYINWAQKDENGDFVAVPDDLPIFGSNVQNPLYQAQTRKFQLKRNRFIGGISAKYDVTNWLTLNGDYSMDRTDYRFSNFYPKGYVTPTPGGFNNGYVSESFTEALTQIYQASAYLHKKFNKDFKGGLTLKYMFEDRDFKSFSASTRELSANVPVLQAGQTDQAEISSTNRPENSSNIFAYLDLDYKDKVIFNGLVRRDGSSLFGEDARYRVYYRTSLAYILSEDVKINGVDFLKLRGSYGTSGQRPYTWFAQYEYYNPTPTGLEAENIGNKNIKPSVVSELEVGLNAAFLKNKLTLEVNYADSRTKDDVLRVPTLPITGFPAQYRNAGALNSNAFEVMLGYNILDDQEKDMSWNVNLSFDRIRQKIGKLNGLEPFTRDTDTALKLFRVEEGLAYGALFGNEIVTSADQLVTNDEGDVINFAAGGGVPAGAKKADFVKNSDGYLVYKDYIDTPNEQALLVSEADGTRTVKQIGNTNPDFNVGFASTFTYKGFSLYGVIDWQQGGDIYNFTKQLLYYNDRHGDQVKYAEQGKFNDYTGGNSTIYNGSDAVSHFVEDGTFVKLRELAVSYTLKGDVLNFAKGKIQDVTFSVTGRNLLTLTKYSGWDPEVALRNNPTNFKIDEYSYPNLRSYTFGVQVKF